MQVRKVAVLFFLLLIASLVVLYLQYRHYENATLDYRTTVSDLREEVLTREADSEMYLAYIHELEARVRPDVVLREQQRNSIHHFILSYFTFIAGEEENRIDHVAEFVTDEMLENMREALGEDPGGNYHLSLEASNISIYNGEADEFLAMFHVAYESEITRSMTQILAVRFVMDEEQIREFVILSASEVFDFD